jgi:hypothetical protein
VTPGTRRACLSISALAGWALLAVGATCDAAHWSFLPLDSVALPTVETPGLTNGIDRLRRLSSGRGPAPAADRRTLIRRLSFDLVGLPPTPEEIRAFEQDRAPGAYDALVDRFLARPQFGERWARHWLDVARYADSSGYERDSDRPEAWHYRDFVIRAFNEDLPFNTFVRWQLAGDLVDPTNPEAVAAAAFLGLGPQVETDTKLKDELARYRYAELDDILSTTGSAFLGLTLGCARCHDHKYDPVSIRDYYSLMGAFVGVERVVRPFGPAAGIGAQAIFSIGNRDPGPPENRLMLRGDPTRPGEILAFGFPAALARGRRPDDYPGGSSPAGCREALAAWMTDADGGAGALLARVIVNRLWQHHFGEGLVQTPADFGTQGDPPRDRRILDWLAGELVRGGWRLKSVHRLIVTSQFYREAVPFKEAEATAGWHRRPIRLEAEVLRDTLLSVSGSLNPLAFGPSVKAPIAAELNVAYNTKDPYPTNAPDSFDTRRRSVYLFTKRSLRHPMFETFDGPDPSATCSRRIPTTVAPQALALLNEPFVRARARDFAGRLARECHSAEGRRVVERAYWLALGRPPAGWEVGEASRFLRQRAAARRLRGSPGASPTASVDALTDFCQVLFGLNEFLYID